MQEIIKALLNNIYERSPSGSTFYLNYPVCIETSSPDPVDVAATFVKLLVEKNELLSGSNNVVL
jgi:hypothetical protein